METDSETVKIEAMEREETLTGTDRKTNQNHNQGSNEHASNVEKQVTYEKTVEAAEIITE